MSHCDPFGDLGEYWYLFPLLQRSDVTGVGEDPGSGVAQTWADSDAANVKYRSTPAVDLVLILAENEKPRINAYEYLEKVKQSYR